MPHIIFDQILRCQRYFALTNYNYETRLLLKTCADQLVNLGECTEIKRHFVTTPYRIIHLSFEDCIIVHMSVVGGPTNFCPFTSVNHTVIVL